MNATTEVIAEFYANACQSIGRLPNEEQGRMWMRQLIGYDGAELVAAFDAHVTDTRTDDRGEIRGKWMPSVAELLAQIQKARAARLTSRKYCGLDGCESGWRFKQGGQTFDGNVAKPTERLAYRCPDCSAMWQMRKAPA